MEKEIDTLRGRRGDYARGAATAGTALALGGAGLSEVQAAGKAGNSNDRAVKATLSDLLVLERLTATLYYAGLTAPAVMRNPALSGPSADPNNPGLPPGGNPQQVRYLQAALDAEMKHAAALGEAGASSATTRFYFPAGAFGRLGATATKNSFLGLVEILETVCVAAYAAAAVDFIRLGRPDLAETAARIMGVESEHRTLGRVIANVTPANNHTLETTPYDSAGEALREIAPFLTGRNYLFASGATRLLHVPTPAQATRVVGTHGTRLVPSFRRHPKGGRR